MNLLLLNWNFYALAVLSKGRFNHCYFGAAEVGRFGTFPTCFSSPKTLSRKFVQTSLFLWTVSITMGWCFPDKTFPLKNSSWKLMKSQQDFPTVTPSAVLLIRTAASGWITPREKWETYKYVDIYFLYNWKHGVQLEDRDRATRGPSRHLNPGQLVQPKTNFLAKKERPAQRWAAGGGRESRRWSGGMFVHKTNCSLLVTRNPADDSANLIKAASDIFQELSPIYNRWVNSRCPWRGQCW